MGKVLPLYYEGALLTLRVGAIGILLALAVGMITAVARYWRIPILNTAAVIYTEFSRNTPLLVHLFFLYFGLPKVSAIALPDLMYVTKDLIGNSYKTDESLILLVSAYVVLLLPISLLGYWLEKKVRYAGFGN